MFSSFSGGGGCRVETACLSTPLCMHTSLWSSILPWCRWSHPSHLCWITPINPWIWCRLSTFLWGEGTFSGKYSWTLLWPYPLGSCFRWPGTKGPNSVLRCFSAFWWAWVSNCYSRSLTVPRTSRIWSRMWSAERWAMVSMLFLSQLPFGFWSVWIPDDKLFCSKIKFIRGISSFGWKPLDKCTPEMQEK